MYYFRIKTFTLICFLVISVSCFSKPGTINDYYSISKNQLLVIPTQNLEPGMIRSVIKKAKELTKFLKQFGPASIVLDKDFSPENDAQGKVVLLFGTEKTNAFLKKHKKFMPVSYKDEVINFYGKKWPGQNNWAIFVNKFPQGKFLVFYLPDLTKLEKAFNVNHGRTSFCIFPEHAFNFNGNAFLAEGNFVENSGDWTIDELSLKENTPLDKRFFVYKKISDDFELKPGDIIKTINGKDLMLSTANSILNDIKSTEGYEIVVLRDGKEKSLVLPGEDMNNLPMDVCFEKIPMVEVDHFLQEAQRLINSFKSAYVDPFNYLETKRFKKSCSLFLRRPSGKSITLLEACKRMLKFASEFSDGHIYTDFSEIKKLMETEFLLKRIKLFPFQPIISGKKLYIPENSLGLPVGAEIVGIGSLDTDKILKILASASCGETYANKLSNFAKRDFAYRLFLSFGEKASFLLRLKANGKAVPHKIKPVYFWQIENTVKQESVNSFKRISKDIIYFKLDSFQRTQKYLELLEKFSAELKENNYKTLILDIRDNSGGNSLALEELLFKISYVPFRVYNATRVKRSRLAEAIYGAKFEQDLDYGQRRVYQCKEELIGDETAFKGRIYLLTGPETFSTAFDCASVLREMKRATLIGEPCGGRMIQTGNHFPIYLFKHLISLTVPYKDFVPWGERFKDFSYSNPKELIEPDYFAAQTESSIATGEDPCFTIIERLEKEYAKKEKFDELHKM